ncbi:MAG: response regulator [Pseudomonadota bacterium]|nr:response regulator [Pseudomonadota bacterium]
MEKSIVHLVDDDPTVRSTLTRLLASGGYRVRTYASGAELIAAADQLIEGCILLDINMPEANGFAVTKALKERGVELPVVMMTGAGDLTLLAWQAGVAAFVPKPFGRKEILSVLDEITEGQFVATAR